jgi:hypothetical protein
MNDNSNDERKRDHVRRVTARDRKRKLKAADPRFPAPDESQQQPTPAPPPPPKSEPEQESEEETPADTDAEAEILTELEAKLASEAAAALAEPIQLETEPEAIPAPEIAPEDKIYTPPEERFPPLEAPRETPPAPPEPPRQPRIAWQDIVAILFLLLSIGEIVLGVIIFRDPYHPLNLLAPPTPLPIFITATFPPPSPAPPVTAEPTLTFTPLAAEVMTDVPPSTLTPTPSPTADGPALPLPDGSG